MNRLLTVAALALAGLFPLAACEKAPEPGKKLFVMVPKGVTPYYGPCWQGFQDAAKKYGVEVEEKTPREFQTTMQVDTLNNVIAENPAGIAISANDDQPLINVVDRATEKGIKVLTFDAPAPSTKALTYIGTLNDQAGYLAGVEMAKLMNNEGEIAFLQGGLGTPNSNARFEGFKKALAEKAPNIKIDAREDSGGTVDLCVPKVENILTTYPNVKALFGINQEGIPGIVSVLKRQNKHLIVAGFDDSTEALSAIRNDSCSFCLAQKTYKMGWMALEKLLDATNGKTLDKQYDTGVIFVTKANVDTYMKDMMADVQK